MAEPAENGPSDYNDKTEQVWERPWTLDEMRNNCSNWSLAADSGLHLYLQEFSQWMLSKTHEIEKQLDGLIRDTKATDSCLHTVFNDFLMLSNIQFIENRVYDEEVEEPVAKPEAQEKRPEQEKTKEQKESELIPKVQEAVSYGLKVLESAFEQLDVKVGNSDSEDEEAADRVEPILEPKDLYVDRPLPYLIGSQAFMEQDDVGLGDLSSDEISIDSDRDIESEEGKDEEDSDQEFDQKVQSSLKKKLSDVSNENDEEENEDSDLFGDSDKDEDELGEDDVGPTSFADELAARIKGDTPSKPDADRASLSSGLSVNKKKSKVKKLPKTQVEDDDEMFKPPEMDEDEFSPFGGKKGLFSGSTNLFDDDEGDLFSEAPQKEKTENEPSASETTERVKTKKIPAGAVSIFPENSLFGSHNGSDSLGSNEDGTAVKPKVQTSSERAVVVGGGLFDEDDDDFFSGSTLKKSSNAAQEKPKSKKTTDLFGGDENDDGDGDIFNVSSPSAAAAAQPTKKVVKVENAGHSPVKKSVPSPKVVKPVPTSKTAEKAKSKGLFSDDEDSNIFPTMPKSHSKPEIQAPIKQSKSAHTIFDDYDEEDLFSSVPKYESSQIKTAAVQPKSSSFFSDDEDQWMSSQPSTVKPEVKSGGMKTSTSAPSRLPSAKAPRKNSLFNDNNDVDDDDDDDLFTATKESSQKKPQRIALLFEDEDAEKGSLFGFTPSADKGNPEVKIPAVSSQAPSLFGSEEKQEVISGPLLKKVTEEKPLGKETVPTTSSPNETNKKKPAGAVSLFGGINVLGDAVKTTKNQSPLDDGDDLNWNKEAPPPLESKKQTAKKNTFSLFDDDDDDDDDEEEPDDKAPLCISAKPAEKITIKTQEQKTHTKSTGVFQDEELLFSQTQLRDNDPEVDLFATSAKPSAPQPSSVKSSTAPVLFGDDDDDDLFSSVKPIAPPKVPVKPSKPKIDVAEKSATESLKNEKPESIVKPKESTSRIGKLQASLSINPASLMPGAGPRISGAVSVIPGHSHAPSSGALGGMSIGPQTAPGEGVNFDAPAQVSTLQSANKDRIKGSMRRRPQTRAARVLAAQRSKDEYLESQEENSNQAGSGVSFDPISSAVRPSALTLPISYGTMSAPGHTPCDETVRPKILPPAQEDLFSSEDLFVPVSVPKHTPSPQSKTTLSEAASNGACKKKDPVVSIFNDNEDLFATVKSKSAKKASAMPFLDDDDNDIFGSEKKKDLKNLGISSKSDIFQGKKETQSKVGKKHKEPSLEVGLFDDDVDIFADFTSTTKPKEQKLKKKVETKSIFDEDMDDIFSSGTTKPVVASSLKKPKKPTQESSSAEESGISIFDDPLNVFGN